MNKQKSINRWFRWESELLVMTGMGAYFFKPGSEFYLSSKLQLLLILIAGTCGGLLTIPCFDRPRSIWQRNFEILLKVIVNLLYVIAISTVISDVLSLLWESFKVAPNLLFYLGSFLVFILILPGYFKLLIDEKRPTLRMLAVFVFYFTSIQITGVLGLGNHYVSQFALLNWLVFIIGTSLVILAMDSWGYRFPRFRFNRGINYWWLALLVFPRFLFMFGAAGSWRRVISLPVTVKLATIGHGLLPITIYIGSTILFICFKEELIFRYLFLNQILAAVKGSTRARVLKAALITSFLFGAWHLQNFSYQTVGATLLQVTAAFAMGMAFAIICLYTGTIWITIFMHSVFDLVVVDPINSQSPFAGQPSAFLIEFILITSAIQIVVALLTIHLAKMRPFEQTIRDNQLLNSPRMTKHWVTEYSK
ncbi:lysostaphin resistance A-like protein [Lentilactobacillus otakiensis]